MGETVTGDGNAFAGLRLANGLEAGDEITCLHAGENGVFFRLAIFGDDAADRFPDHLLRGPSEQALRGAIPRLDGPVESLGNDRVGRILDDRGESRGVVFGRGTYLLLSRCGGLCHVPECGQPHGGRIAITHNLRPRFQPVRTRGLIKRGYGCRVFPRGTTASVRAPPGVRATIVPSRGSPERSKWTVHVSSVAAGPE